MPLKKSEAGVSMLEVLISAGILALIIPFALKMFLNSRQSQVSNETKLNLRSLSRTIETMVDCPNVPKTCTSGSLLAIPKRNGGTLIAADGQTQMSSWFIRALCTGGNQFRVIAVKGAQDPIPLFPEKTLCSSQQAAQTLQEDDLIEVMPGSSCVVNDAAHLPCHPPQPPACDSGYASRGTSLDTFGGDDDPDEVHVFGQRWMRYCSKIP